MSPGGQPHRAKKSLGQNFLIDPNLQRKIVRALGAASDDEVVEVGPGRGALTRHLEGSVRKLVLIELDDRLAADLSADFEGRKDVDVVHGDVLEVPWADHVDDPSSTLVIGNIPYNITTPIIFRLLKRPRPRDIVLMVQDEVADRVVAPVGGKAYGALSVGIRIVAGVEKLFRVRRGAFKPVPGVDSAILRITPLRPEPLSAAQEVGVRRLVRASFQWRRKQIGTILRDHPELGLEPGRVDAVTAQAVVDPTDRPERLSPEAFVRLANALA